AGAHTGEISAPMLADLGCRWVLVGHSERRKEIGESDEVINLKLRAAMAHGLTPVLCVGETAEERRQGFTFTTVEGQLRAGLAGVTAAQMERSSSPTSRSGPSGRASTRRRPRPARSTATSAA